MDFELFVDDVISGESFKPFWPRLLHTGCNH